MNKDKAKSLNSYPEILTAKEVSIILGIKIDNAYKMFRAGTIRAFKVGNRWRIPKKELKAYIDYENKLKIV